MSSNKLATNAQPFVSTISPTLVPIGGGKAVVAAIESKREVKAKAAADEKKKCLDCSGYQPGEVDRCAAIACSVWPYRFGTNPFSNWKGNAEALIRARGAKQVKDLLEDDGAPDVDHYPDAPALPEPSGAPGGDAGTAPEAPQQGKGGGA